MAREKVPGEKRRTGAGDVLSGDFEEREAHEKQVDEDLGKPKHLDFFDRYLFIWIFVCMGIGLGLGKLFPGLGPNIDKVKIGFVSIPIAVGLFMMMFPIMLRIRLEDAAKAVRSWKELGIVIFFCWFVSAFYMYFLSWVFLRNHPEYAIGVILLSIAPCIAMVLMWSYLADGNNALAMVLMAINSVVQMFIFSFLAYFLSKGYVNKIAASGKKVDFNIARVNIPNILITVLIFLGVPLVIGFFVRRRLVKTRGEDWIEHKLSPWMRAMAIVGLLFTLIVMFTLKGEVIIDEPVVVLLVAIPVTIFFFTMFAGGYFTAWLFNIDYQNSVVVGLTGSSNNFELAIAVAAAVFGISSRVTLATVIGPLIEVPIMLVLVKIGLSTRKYFPRNRKAIAAEGASVAIPSESD
ncbi:MAG TPA: ACR3 family arsenite efflux transporter [Candidatus Anoxymicrobiaceae bacterium]